MKLGTFFSELVSGLVLLAFGSFTVPWYLDWRRKPHLTIINPETRNETFSLSRSTDGFWESTLHPSIKNHTKFTQREWYWHILVPKELNQNVICLDRASTPQRNEVTVNGQTWVHYFGNASSNEVIFPHRSLRFNYMFKVKTSSKDKKEYKVHYYFDTEFGAWPPKARQIESIATNSKRDQSTAFTEDYLASFILRPDE